METLYRFIKTARRSGVPALALVLVSALSTGVFAKKPNTLLVMTDNTGWADFDLYGGSVLQGAPPPTSTS